VAVSGKYAYLADGPAGFHVIDITNPAHPQAIGECQTTGDAHAVAVAGPYAYVLERWCDDSTGPRGRLQVIDITKPAKPQRVGECDTGFWGQDVAVSGKYAYVAGDGGLQVIDISNPARPQWVGICETIDRAVGVAVSGTYAYVATETEWEDPQRLKLIDVSNPVAPTLVREYETDGWLYNLPASTNFTYVRAGDADWEVIDVSAPEEPKRVGLYSAIVSAFGGVVSANHAFVWGTVIDISNPAHPQELGYCVGSGLIGGLAVSGNYLYLATSGDGQIFLLGEGLLVFDVSVLANPQRVGSYQTDGWASRLAVSGNYAYVVENSPEDGADADHLLIVDISTPANPRQVGRSSSIGWIQDVAVSGNYAYVASDTRWDGSQDVGGGLQVIDIRNPSVPLEVSRFNTNGSVYAVAVSGNYAYAAGFWHEGTNSLAGLQVIDISDAANPHRIGSLEGTPAQPVALAVGGNHAYLVGSRYDGVNWIAGLQVIDISDPANPRRSGTYETSEDEWGAAAVVVVAGNYAYVTRNSGLLVIDVSDPARPKPVGAYGGFRAVAVSGSYAYGNPLGWRPGWPGLEVLDISDPANPRRVGGNSLCAASDLAVAGNLVYAVGYYDGLVILNTYQPPPRIESAEFGDDGFQLVFRGEAGRTIRLQRSPDLKTWYEWFGIPATGESQVVIDSSVGSHPCQFYRAIGQ
jgi:hypothetical protein